MLGASIAGLSAAGELSRLFEEVVVDDKDARSASLRSRRGVPQGSHVHSLQRDALNQLNDFFPGVTDTLVNAGAVSIDFGDKVRTYLADGWVPAKPTGLARMSLTRSFLEYHTAVHARAIENVRFARSLRVRGITGSDAGVTGVHCERDG